MKCKICLNAINALRYKQLWMEAKSRKRESERKAEWTRKVEEMKRKNSKFVFVCVSDTLKYKIKVHSKFMWCLQNIQNTLISIRCSVYLASFTILKYVDVVLRQFHLALRQWNNRRPDKYSIKKNKKDADAYKIYG